MSRTARAAPLAEEPARKYLRPRLTLSWPGLIVGLLLGVGLGLFYAWGVNPVVEFDTEPWQLRDADKAHYIVAIMLDYSYDSDLDHAVDRLLALRLKGDPIQAVADAACQLASSGYVESNSGLRAIRAMMTFYQLQGKQGCADTLIPAPEMRPTPAPAVVAVQPTATFIPPATKTATPQGPVLPTATPFQLLAPTASVGSDFVAVNVSTFCDADRSGLIEVFVQDAGGSGLPGQQVRVRWDSGEDRFYTGLKPERDAGYADFAMTAGTGYVVDMPGRSEPTANPVSAVRCTANDGSSALISYRVVFRPA